jgi:hypothetical protein
MQGFLGNLFFLLSAGSNSSLAVACKYINVFEHIMNLIFMTQTLIAGFVRRG